MVTKSPICIPKVTVSLCTSSFLQTPNLLVLTLIIFVILLKPNHISKTQSYVIAKNNKLK